MSVHDRVLAHLEAHSVPFERLEHPAATTAEEAAALRGTDLSIGGKAIVMKADKRGFCVLALRGSDTIDNRAFRKHLGVRRYRFATRDELDELTGLTPGCIPPFGRPIFELPLFADAALLANERIAFTPGTHHASLVMAVADWRVVAQPEDCWAFAKPAD